MEQTLHLRSEIIKRDQIIQNNEEQIQKLIDQHKTLQGECRMWRGKYERIAYKLRHPKKGNKWKPE